MTLTIYRCALLSAALAAAACATQPIGPATYAMPSPYKPFEVFAQDQSVCRAYASQQVAGATDAANSRGVASALIGAALGAGLGAAIGDGRGAGIGAAYGALAGTAIGASDSYDASYGVQRRYDIEYGQCMYAKGNQVPGFAAPSYMPPPPPRYRG